MSKLYVNPWYKNFTQIYSAKRCNFNRYFHFGILLIYRIVEKKFNKSNVSIITVCFVPLKQALSHVGAKEVGELEKHLGVLELAGMPGSACIRVQPACAITGEGLHEGLDTLYQLILKRRKLAKLNRKRAR